MNLFAIIPLLVISYFSFSQTSLDLFERYNPKIKLTHKRIVKKAFRYKKYDSQITGDNLTDPDREFHVNFDHYIPNKERYQNAILIQPPTGGSNILDRGYARSLARKGFHVIIMKTWTDGQGEENLNIHDVDLHNRGNLRSILATKYLIEYLGRDVGILGTSVGAIYSTSILAIESRVKAGVLIAGGAPQSNVIAYSDEEFMTSIRESRMEKLGLESKEEYLEYLDNKIKIRPYDLVLKHFRNKPVLSFIATRDHTVDTVFQERLWQAMGKQKVFRFKAKHTPAIIRTYLFKKSKVCKFFEDHLK